MILNMVLSIFKQYWLQIWAAIVTLLCAFLLTRPTPKPIVTTKTEYIDKIVTKTVDKIVYKDVIKWRDRIITKTVTKPGGTTIVETTKETSGEGSESRSVEKEQEHDKTTVAKSEVTILPPSPKFLLNISGNPYTGIYSTSAGFRLHSAIPLYLGPGVIRNPDTSYKLLLSLGVIF